MIFSFLTAKIMSWATIALTLGIAIFVGRCALKDYWLRQAENERLHQKVKAHNEVMRKAREEHEEYQKEREEHPVDGDELSPDEKLDNAFKLLRGDRR